MIGAAKARSAVRVAPAAVAAAAEGERTLGDRSGVAVAGAADESSAGRGIFVGVGATSEAAMGLPRADFRGGSITGEEVRPLAREGGADKVRSERRSRNATSKPHAIPAMKMAMRGIRRGEGRCEAEEISRSALRKIASLR